MDANKTIDLVDGITSVILLSLMILRQLTGETDEEVMAAIKEGGARTDELLKQLK